jgi:hypothetical protein
MRRGNPRVSEGRPFESSDCWWRCPRLEEQRVGISRTYAGSDVALSRLLLSSYHRLIHGLYLFGGLGEKPQVRLPGFITDEAIGLGDAIKRATYAVGIKPCGGCERRAATLNRWLGFSGRPPQ